MEARSHAYVLDEPGSRLPDRVRDELMTTFAVDEDRGVTRVRRTWLDTFDWRLYRAGLTLQHAGPRGHGELVLTGPAGQQLAARFADPAGPWPCPPEALPPGPLRDQVAAVAGLRALLPVVTAVSQVHEVRLLNADDKTVTRIAVDAMALPGPCPGSLPTRLAVTGVRGYAGAARRACRVLDDAAGVTLSGQTALDAALHAAGRHALDYTGKVDVALGPGMPGAEAVTAILLQQLDTLEANVDGVLHDTDTEFLHDLRIAVRRTRSALKLLGDMLPGELTLRFASEFRWLGDITTPLRDLDVQLLSVPPMAAGLVAARPADLDPFLAYLARRAHRRTAEAQPGAAVGAVRRRNRRLAQGAARPARDTGPGGAARRRPVRGPYPARLRARPQAGIGDHSGLAPGKPAHAAQTRQGTPLRARVLRVSA